MDDGSDFLAISTLTHPQRNNQRNNQRFDLSRSIRLEYHGATCSKICQQRDHPLGSANGWIELATIIRIRFAIDRLSRIPRSSSDSENAAGHSCARLARIEIRSLRNLDRSDPGVCGELPRPSPVADSRRPLPSLWHPSRCTLSEAAR